MADDVVIRAMDLGKKYVIGHQTVERVPTLRDAISRTTTNLVRTTRDLLRGKPLLAGDEFEEFWALKDVSFDIRRGDVVGIIGRNGAGKSTLLKVLSRITEPSEGRVELQGRVASLLEVGTGFHPELTGRENIFLNGAILGMERREIRKKFDEIVAFAEVEKFLDTPVKRYSSGMYVRLAFAVAAHLEPEILIVDEVLAVGDAEFQRKCLGKMQDVAGAGRTVLFVSHNLATISALCSRTMLLQSGSCVHFGSTSEALLHYNRSSSPHRPSDTAITSGDYAVSFLNIRETPGTLGGTRISANLTIASPNEVDVAMNMFLRDEAARPAGACSFGGMGANHLLKLKKGSNSFELSVNLPRLAEGAYHFDVELADRFKNRLAEFNDAVHFHLSPEPEQGCSEVLRQSWGFGSTWMTMELR